MHRSSLIFGALTLMITVLSSCVEDVGESITLYVNRPVGAKLFLGLDSRPEDRDKIWIDLNENGKKDRGEGVTSFYGADTPPSAGEPSCGEFGEYIISGTRISVHGPVTVLVCNSGAIYEMDLSQCSSLRTLVCQHNHLKVLDLSANVNLTSLDCEDNKLSALDLTNNPLLSHLNVTDNRLKDIDLRSNQRLLSLTCVGTDIEHLDLSENKELSVLVISSNRLNQLDLSQNSRLTRLTCVREDIPTLDLTNNTALAYLRCHNCLLSALDISSEAPISSLFISDNKLEKAALEAIFENLSSSPGVFCIEGNPGGNVVDRTGVFSKGWAELSKKELAESDL